MQKSRKLRDDVALAECDVAVLSRMLTEVARTSTAARTIGYDSDRLGITLAVLRFEDAVVRHLQGRDELGRDFRRRGVPAAPSSGGKKATSFAARRVATT
jgi:2-polyprenyl-6-methoxyphenol hydroxylase-like FAD-dependent oxidoreductase